MNIMYNCIKNRIFFIFCIFFIQLCSNSTHIIIVQTRNYFNPFHTRARKFFRLFTTFSPLDKAKRKGYNAFTMKNILTVRPIAHIRSDFKEKFGIPRQSGRAPALEAEIIFETEFRNPDALRGIEEFSHLWLIFDFSAAHREEWSATVRPPRLGGNTRVGVFASRSPFRPNPLGLSCVQLLRVEKRENEGCVLIVSGADLLDGTPILDIKPYLPFADCQIEATGGYASAHEKDGVEVLFPEELLQMIPESKREGLLQCLADDPRPSYQEDETRVYGMKFAEFDVKFSVQANKLTVVSVTK